MSAILKMREHNVESFSSDELKLRRTLYPDVSVVEGRRVQCTVCLKDIKHVILYKRKAYVHKQLKVLLCKDCYSFYGDGEFSVDEDGLDKYCRWCGQGGQLYMCSDCPCAFCKKCIKQNLARKVLNEIEEDDWKCFMCCKKPLFELRALCWAVLEHISNLKNKPSLSNKPDKYREANSITPIGDLCSKLPDDSFRSKQLLLKGKKWLGDFRSDIGYFGSTLTKRIDSSTPNHSNLVSLSDVNISINDHIRIIEQSVQTLNELNRTLINFHKSWKKELKEAVENHLKEKVVEVIDIADNNSQSETENSEVISELRVNRNGLQNTPITYSNSKVKRSSSVCDDDKTSDTATANIEVPKNVTTRRENETAQKTTTDNKDEEEEEIEEAEPTKPLKPLLRIKNVDELNGISGSTSEKKSITNEDNKIDNIDDSVSINSASDSDNGNNSVNGSIKVKSKDKVGNNKGRHKNINKSNDEIDSNVIDNSVSDKSDDTVANCDSDVRNVDLEGNENNSIVNTNKSDNNMNSQAESCALQISDKETKEKQSSSIKRCNEVQKESSTDSSAGTLFSSDSSESVKAMKKRSPVKRKRHTSESSSDKKKTYKKCVDMFDETSSDSSFSLNRMKKVKPRDNKMKIMKEKVADVNEEEDKPEKEQNFFSDSEDDLRKILDLKSLEMKKRKRSESETSSSVKDTATKNKRKSTLSKQQLSLLDCLEGSDDENNEDDCPNLDELPLPSLNIKFSDFNLARDLLDAMSHSEVEIYSLDGDDATLPDKGDGKKVKKKYTKKKTNSDGDNDKSSRKVRLKRDKLLKMKLTDTDSSEAEEKWRKYKQREEAKKTEESNNSGIDEKYRKVVKKRKKYRKSIMLFSSDSCDGSTTEIKSQEEDEKDSKTESDNEKTPPPNKNRRRRRIKAQSSNSTDSDNEEGAKITDSAGKGRKNIRKVLKEDNLRESTQSALKEEQERKKRIAEKQKMYNSFLNKSEEVGEVKEIEEVVLDFDPNTKTTLLALDNNLVKKLKPHQAEGIKFMWDSCFESLEDIKTKKGSGCILAHCMGLGKSLQVVSLLHALLTNEKTGINTALVVCPVSTVLNWVNEFDKWLKDVGSGQDIQVYHMAKTQTSYRVFQLKDWHKTGGIMILGYNLYRILANEKQKLKASAKAVYRQTLVDPGPDIVICDEGHLLKNEATALSVAMNKIKTKRRIVLTGTPLQNNLVEYHCMVQFVKPNLLGTKKEFKNRFVNPIQNGQFEDSTAHDVKLMKRRAHVLHTMLDGIVQRKDYNVLTPYLPPKYEYVIHLKMSELQCTLYQHYLDHEAKRKLFIDFQSLMRICIHPQALHLKSERDLLKEEEEESEGSIKDFIDDGSAENSSSSSSSLSSSNSESDRSKSKETAAPKRRTRATGLDQEIEEEAPIKNIEWWSDLVDDKQLEDIRQGSKIFLFFVILKYCEDIGDKLLVFSQSLFTLDVIEFFLNKIDENAQKSEPDLNLSEFGGSWAKGLDYFRMDGGSSFDLRNAWCKAFNNERNTRARLFLISTRAGGLGINLTGANRVIIFDASWNPSYDVQSLFRVYRFGQKKPCYIYRFLSKGTMEEKIYERQVAKLSTSLRVIDEHQIDRHFSHSALAELYTFDPEGSELRATPVLPKDRLMAELLQSHSDIILSYHQHDSLLENQEDQELSEEERKAAWLEFENEKKPQPQWPTSMILLNDVEQRLKAQNPNLTDDECKQRALDIFQKYQLLQQQQKFLQITQQQQNMQQQSSAQVRPVQNWLYTNYSTQQPTTTGAIFSNNYQPYRFPQGILDKTGQQPFPVQQINTQSFGVNPKASAAARTGRVSDAVVRSTSNHQVLKAPPEMSSNKDNANIEPIVLNDD